MIKLVLLFTNRNVIAFDEKGEQVPEIAKALNWSPDYRDIEQKALERIIDDNAETDIVRHHCWRHPITTAEFCSLLGHGEWYMQNYPERWRKETESD